MAEPVQAALHFLPWVRQGMATNIATVDTLSSNQSLPATTPLALQLWLNETNVTLQARISGPGDVLGIDPRQIVRTDPRARTSNFEPNYFPAIEFDSPDLPWLFTPAKANANQQLRPWLCLIVVRQQPGVTLRPGSNTGLPILEIKAPAVPGDELPDLRESWAWAHAQVAGSIASLPLATTIKEQPGLSLSRLLCPRRLQPSTAYIACLVPTFDAGVRRGLGISAPGGAPESAQTLLPAWLSGAQSPAEIILPVYYSWEFRTGVAGDFESLVRVLKPRVLDPRVGRRQLDIGNPGYRITQFPGTIVNLEAALRPVTSQTEALPLGYANALRAILNAPSTAAPEGVTDPLIGPPLYGDQYAQVNKLEPAPGWLNELNLDPRHRVAASLGTGVIQQEQEALMASAWEQVERIRAINQASRLTQLAIVVGEQIHKKHLRAMPIDALLQITAPAHGQLMLNATLLNLPQRSVTMTHLLKNSKVPERVVSAPMRRIARPRGALNRRFALLAPGTKRTVRPIFTFLNTATIVFIFPEPGMATVDNVSKAVEATLPAATKIRYAQAHRLAMEGARTRIPFTIRQEGAIVPPVPPPGLKIFFPENPVAQSFRAAALAHQQYMVGGPPTLIAHLPAFVSQTALQSSLLASLAPASAISERLIARINLPALVAQADEPPTQVMAAPEFPHPMVNALRDLSQEHLLPGLEHVQPDTVALLMTNRTFIESFMIGLNHEMGRELLWREYPTDRRGLYFRQFWDRRGASGASASQDIQPLPTWKNSDSLGKKYTGREDHLILLIRGELLRRYPGAVFSAVRAVQTPSGQRRPGTEEKLPIFRGSLQPDVTYLGFDLTPAQVLSGPGWFFVIEQQPSEPRFGLDLSDTAIPTKPGRWNDLSWGHLVANDAALARLQHVPIRPNPLENHSIAGVTWGANAAHMASITLQKPVRIAIHATQMISLPNS